MSYGERTRNPHLDTEQDDQDNPVTCHFCGDYLGQYELMTPLDGIVYHGHWYCHKHSPVLADLEQASRRDIERDEMNERRR